MYFCHPATHAEVSTGAAPCSFTLLTSYAPYCSDCHAGVAFIDLPEDVLLGIAWHFDLKEWANGPAQVSRALYRMRLPRVILDVLEVDVSSYFLSHLGCGKARVHSCGV